MLILIVEDEKALADIIKKGPEEEDYAMDAATMGRTVFFWQRVNPLVLL